LAADAVVVVVVVVRTYTALDTSCADWGDTMQAGWTVASWAEK
jgi:hypothetical protein